MNTAAQGTNERDRRDIELASLINLTEADVKICNMNRQRSRARFAEQILSALQELVRRRNGDEHVERAAGLADLDADELTMTHTIDGEWPVGEEETRAYVAELREVATLVRVAIGKVEG